MPSSQTFVPEAINDCIGVLISGPPFGDGILWLLYRAPPRSGCIAALQLQLGDGFAMHLIGSIRQAERPGAGPGRSQAKILAHSRSTMSLDRSVDDPQGHLGRDRK